MNRLRNAQGWHTGLMDRLTSLLTATALVSFAVTGTSRAQDFIPPKVETTVAVGVDAFDATLRVDNVDLSIGDLTLERFHANQTAPVQLDSTEPVGKAVQALEGIPETYDFGFRMSTNMDIFVVPQYVLATTHYITEWNGVQYNALLPVRYHTTVHLGKVGSGLYNWDGAKTINPINQDAESGILTISNGSFQYTDSGGNVYNFSSSVRAGGNVNEGTPGSDLSQKVTNIIFSNGRIRNFYYTSGGNLKFVLDSKGYGIIFDYGSSGVVSDACAVDLALFYATANSTCDKKSLISKYTYTVEPAPFSANYPNSAIFMNTFTDVIGATTSYSYGPNSIGTTYPTYIGPRYAGDINCITPPGYSACKQSSVDLSGATETLIDGSIWNVYITTNNYALNTVQNDPFGKPGPTGDTYNPPLNCGKTVTVTDPNQNISVYNFTNSSPCNYTDANNNLTQYGWLGGALWEPSERQPANDGSLLSLVIFPEGNTYSATFSQTNFNAPTQEVMTAKPKSGLPNRVVNYTYGAMGTAGVTYQNLAKPLSRVDPNGNETDWTYASWGGVLTEMKPAPSTGAARPLTLYTYQQLSANILNSKGALVSTGQPIWMPATETECQTAAGSSVTTCDANAPQKVITYQYGAAGTADNLLLHGMKESSGGVTLVTCYSYDQWSHKISETSPNANLTSCP